MPARGRHPHKKLTDLAARQARPGRHSDGEGLYLFVRESGARQWVQRLTIHGRRRDLGLGPYPRVSLADAGASRSTTAGRLVAAAIPRLRRRARRGRPSAASTRSSPRSVARAGTRRLPRPPGAVASRSTFSRSSATSPSLRSPLRMFATLSFPLERAQQHGLHSAAEPRVRSALCRRREAAPRQSAADLRVLLPRVRRVSNHRASLHYAEAPAVMAEWQTLSMNPAVTLAVLFIVLTAARLSEATQATWSEIDLPRPIWTVPARA